MSERPSAVARAAPALFVAMWSTGFIAAKLGLPYAGPFSFLAFRFTVTAALLALVALATGAPWPRDRALVGHLAVTGLLVHAVYLGGVFYAIETGVPAGVSALVVGLQPLLVGLLAGRLSGDRLDPLDWLGLVAGFGGVTLAVWHRLGSGFGTPAGVAANVLALLAITAGTFYQKRFGGQVDMRAGNAVQFGAAALVTAPIALAVGEGPIRWTAAFAFAVGWSIVVLSLGAVSLLYFLIRRGSAARVSSLIYLTPPTTAVMAYAVFGETLTPWPCSAWRSPWRAWPSSTHDEADAGAPRW
ncbi:MAG TPA: DMT family transporter [Thermodesulfobacteriota bacterium]